MKHHQPGFRSLRSLAATLVLWIMVSSGFSQSGNPYRQAALSNLRNNRFPEAIENLNIAIQKEPGSSELYFYRGYAKSNLDDFFGAERDYTISIDLSPFRAEAFVNRGIIRSQLEHYPEAFADFGKAIELDSTNTDAYLNRARAHLVMKNFYACLLDCNTAIRLKESNETVYILKGSAETNLKRYDNAVASLTTAITMNPENAYCYTQRGLVYLEKERIDSAIADMNKAILADSNNIYALFNRSLVLAKLENQEGALADLNKIIRLSPYNSYAYYNRAITRIGLNDKKGAIRDFEIVSKLNPTNIVSCFYRSKLKTELKDYRGALEDLNRTLELYPDYTEAYYDRYLLKLKLSDRKGAQQDYRKVEELSRKNNLTTDSLKARKDNYLKSLVRLSGDFEEMNTENSKFQNRYIRIELMPPYRVFPGKADYNMIRLYDAYRKPHYYRNIISLTNREDLMTDSLCRSMIRIQNERIDSALSNPDPYWKRALAYAGMKEYNRAMADYEASVSRDSALVLAWFSRANTRYDLVRMIQAQEAREEEPMLIGIPSSRADSTMITPELEHTFGAVLYDLDRAIFLDPEFYFARYNRGYIHTKMGNYRDAEEDFSGVIEQNDKFPDAFYNRGLIRILLNDRAHGCQDLSRAGELGITDAYKVMKRYCGEK